MMHPDHASGPTSPQTGSPWDGRRHCGHRHFHAGHHHHRAGGVVLGLTVIAWGGLLLLRELELIPAHLQVLDFWPLLLVGFGLARVAERRSLGAVLFGLAVALLGAGLLAERLGYLSAGVAHLWPLLIVAAGLGILWNGMTRPQRPRRLGDETVTEGVLQRSVTMGSLKLVVDSQEFKGATLSATMGGMEVDLRRAAIAGDEVTVQVALVMSGVELYVPSSWQVVSELSPFMGAVEDRTAPHPDAAGVQKRLILRGSITMGAVEIRN